MKLDEAIELLQQDIENPGSVDMSELNAAEQLGIAAMKAILEWRSHLGSVGCLPLPSETQAYCKFCGLAHTDIECPDRGREK